MAFIRVTENATGDPFIVNVDEIADIKETIHKEMGSHVSVVFFRTKGVALIAREPLATITRKLKEAGHGVY